MNKEDRDKMWERIWEVDSMFDELEFERRKAERLQKHRTEELRIQMLKESQKERGLLFAQADKLKTELLLLDNTSDEECAEIAFKVQNDCAFPIESLRIENTGPLWL